MELAEAILDSAAKAFTEAIEEYLGFGVHHVIIVFPNDIERVQLMDVGICSSLPKDYFVTVLEMAAKVAKSGYWDESMARQKSKKEDK